MSTAVANIFRVTTSSASSGGAGVGKPAKGEGWTKIQHQNADYSVFLNQPNAKIQVQDSGVALSSFASKPVPPTGQEPIDDDWEVVYPDS